MAIIKNPITVVSGGGPAPSTPSQWGRLWCWRWTEGWVLDYDPESCEVEFDQATFDAFVAEHPLSTESENPQVSIEYDAMSGGIPMMTIYGFEEPDPLYGSSDPQDLVQMGLTVTNYDPDGMFFIGMEWVAEYEEGISLQNPPEPKICFELNETQYNALGNYDQIDGTLNLAGIKIPSECVAKFEFGTQATTTPKNFLTHCPNLRTIEISNWNVTTIGDSFCVDCQKLNLTSTLDLSSVTSIGDSFLLDCQKFNQPIIFSNNLTSIGSGFLCYAYEFNQPLSLPNSLTSIGSAFLGKQRDMVSTVNANDLAASVFQGYNQTMDFSASSMSSAAYTSGIPIAGTHAADILAKFPDTTINFYRNTKAAE